MNKAFEVIDSLKKTGDITTTAKELGCSYQYVWRIKRHYIEKNQDKEEIKKYFDFRPHRGFSEIRMTATKKHGLVIRMTGGESIESVSLSSGIPEDELKEYLKNFGLFGKRGLCVTKVQKLKEGKACKTEEK